MDLVGNVEGCDVIMVDDLIDTAGTLTQVTWPGSEYVVSYHTLMVALCNACCAYCIGWGLCGVGQAAALLKEKGARRIFAFATHGMAWSFGIGIRFHSSLNVDV